MESISSKWKTILRYGILKRWKILSEVTWFFNWQIGILGYLPFCVLNLDTIRSSELSNFHTVCSSESSMHWNILIQLAVNSYRLVNMSILSSRCGNNRASSAPVRSCLEILGQASSMVGCCVVLSSYLLFQWKNLAKVKFKGKWQLLSFIWYCLEHLVNQKQLHLQ